MAGITLFLPTGILGFIPGFAIGFYLDATLTNILDEIFGKGYYRELLTTESKIMATSLNLNEALVHIKNDLKLQSVTESEQYKAEYNTKLFSDFDKKMEEINGW